MNNYKILLISAKITLVLSLISLVLSRFFLSSPQAGYGYTASAFICLVSFILFLLTAIMQIANGYNNPNSNKLDSSAYRILGGLFAVIYLALAIWLMRELYFGLLVYILETFLALFIVFVSLGYAVDKQINKGLVFGKTNLTRIYILILVIPLIFITYFYFWF